MIFTDHVRNPKPDDFNQVVESLAKILKKRMRKKGVFSLPPAYLDYPEHSSWNDPEAVKDVVYDLYGYCFVQKRKSLLLALDKLPDIEGVVVCNIDNFIFMRQSKRDPFGYKSYKNCRAALLALENLGIVVSEKAKGGKTIRIAGAENKITDNRADLDIVAFVQKHNGWSLNAHSVTRLCNAGKDFLTKLILDLFAAGVRCFRFEDFVVAVKTKVRSCILVQSFDEEMHSSGDSQEDSGKTALTELFDLGCVRDKIGESRNSSSRKYLSTMLKSLIDEYRDGGDFNLAEMANKMGLPTSTHHDQWKKLRGFLRECARGANSG